MSFSDKPQVFLSYAHDDLDKVRRLYHDLKKRDVNLWFDKEDLGPGRWKTQIEKAIPKSRYFLFCISKNALRKTSNGIGFVEDELQFAYEIARAQDERNFTIIPVRLDDSGHGDHRLSSFQQVDLFENWDHGVNQLALQVQGTSITNKQNMPSKSDSYSVETDKSNSDPTSRLSSTHKMITILTSIIIASVALLTWFNVKYEPKPSPLPEPPPCTADYKTIIADSVRNNRSWHERMKLKLFILNHEYAETVELVIEGYGLDGTVKMRKGDMIESKGDLVSGNQYRLTMKAVDPKRMNDPWFTVHYKLEEKDCPSP